MAGSVGDKVANERGQQRGVRRSEGRLAEPRREKRPCNWSEMHRTCTPGWERTADVRVVEQCGERPGKLLHDDGFGLA